MNTQATDSITEILDIANGLIIDSICVELSSEWEKYEGLRKKFINDFTIRKIGEMVLDGYVVGKNSSIHTFCYRLEYETKLLGSISGINANKYGIYYNKKSNEYKYINKWGEDKKTAFKNIKDAIIELIIHPNDINKIKKNMLCNSLKGKILFLYHPDKYCNIFSIEHLKHFAEALHLKVSHTEDFVDLQNKLTSFRNNHKKFNTSIYLLAAYLYKFFSPLSNKNQKIKVNASQQEYFIVNNWLEHNLKCQLIGSKGEELVLEYEKKKLKDAKMEHLISKIVHESKLCDSSGYDIKSFDTDGNEIYIEVKSTTISEDTEISFFLSGNELKKSKKYSNYYLYRVFLIEDNPKLLVIKNPDFTNIEAFTLTPISYKVNCPKSIFDVDYFVNIQGI